MNISANLEHQLSHALYQCASEEFKNCIFKGHHIYTDFLHYSQLVERLVETTKQTVPDKPKICFTGLCVPPFQWLNFTMDGRETQSFESLRVLEANKLWTKYLRFWQDEAKNTSLYRVLMHVKDEDFAQKPRYCSFPRRSTVEFQLGEATSDDGQKNRINVIYKEGKNGSVLPLTSVELRSHLGVRIKNGKKYGCYAESKEAFLIVEEKDHIELNGAEFQCKDIRELLNGFQTGPLLHWDATPRAELPSVEYIVDDFFMVGFGENAEAAEWQFALVADVAPDYLGLFKIRLWFLSENAPARIRSNAHPRFEDYITMQQFRSRVKDYIVKNAKQW